MVDDFIMFIQMLALDFNLFGELEFAQVLGRPAGWHPLYALCANGSQWEQRMTTGLL